MPRKPKQKSDDFDLGFVDSLLDVLDIDNNDEAVDVEAKSEDLVSLEDVDETPKSQGGYQAPSKPDYKELMLEHAQCFENIIFSNCYLFQSVVLYC